MKFINIIISKLTSFFSVNTLQRVFALLFLLMLGLLVWKFDQVNDLKEQVQTAQEEAKIHQRNLAVLEEKEKEWIAKDSSKVKTISLLSATNETWKSDFKDLSTKFNNLILDNNKKIQRQTYLEQKIQIQDSIIAEFELASGDTTASYIANDSTIKINETHKYDERNYSSLSGSVKLRLDSNKIKFAELNLSQKFGIGIDLATYRDANGVPKVSVATKYPGAILNISGIQDVNDQLSVNKAKVKSSFGIGLSVGYGYIIGSDTKLQRGVYVGAGLQWQPSFLRFNKK